MVVGKGTGKKIIPYYIELSFIMNSIPNSIIYLDHHPPIHTSIPPPPIYSQKRLSQDTDQIANSSTRGRDGDEVHDYGYTFNNARRRSNSSTQGLADFRTKFETIDPEPVFEEHVHGAEVVNENGDTVTKVASASSSSPSDAGQNEFKV